MYLRIKRTDEGRWAVMASKDNVKWMVYVVYEDKETASGFVDGYFAYHDVKRDIEECVRWESGN